MSNEIPCIAPSTVTREPHESWEALATEMVTTLRSPRDYRQRVICEGNLISIGAALDTAQAEILSKAKPTAKGQPQ